MVKKKQKLFIQTEKYTRDDGVVVTKFRPTIDVYIKAIDLNTGKVEYKKILEYSKHENLTMYDIISKTNKFKTFTVSDDHSLIVYDVVTKKLRKISPLTIKDNPSRYYLVQNSVDNLIPCTTIEIKKSDKTTGYDFTVEDYYTFCTDDGIFVQDTMGVYFVNSEEAKQEIHDSRVHAMYHLKYLSNDTFLHRYRHEMLFALYKLSEIDETKTPIKLGPKTLNFNLNYVAENYNTPVIIEDKNNDNETIKISYGLYLINYILFDGNIRLKNRITKSNVNDVNKELYDYVFNKKALSDKKKHQLYLDKIHELLLFISDIVSFTNLNPSISINDYKYYPDIEEDIDNLPDEPYTGSVIYDKLSDRVIDNMSEDNATLYDIYKSGARASKSQISQVTVARGYIADDKNIVKLEPIRSNLIKGYTEDDIFKSAYGARKGLIDKQANTPQSGVIYRSTTMNTSFVIVDHDKDFCGTDRFLIINVLNENHAKSLIGRYIYSNGKIQKIRPDNYHKIINKKIRLLSPIYCKHDNFMVCKKCSGNFNKKSLGMLSSSFFSERLIQLTLRTFHLSGAAILHVHDELYEFIYNSDIKFISPTQLDPSSIDIDKLNVLLDKYVNSRPDSSYKVHINDDGRIVTDGILINEDIISSIKRIRGFLTKKVNNIFGEDIIYTPENVYTYTISEYLKHGFIKSLYIETILSILWYDKKTNTNIRYLDEIDWEKVYKASIKVAGANYSSLLAFLFEPNRQTAVRLAVDDSSGKDNTPYKTLIVR